jgi:hypothetical protein
MRAKETCLSEIAFSAVHDVLNHLESICKDDPGGEFTGYTFSGETCGYHVTISAVKNTKPHLPDTCSEGDV